MELGINRVPDARKARIRYLTKYWLQPSLMVLALLFATLAPDELYYGLFFFAMISLLTCLEVLIPARPEWQETFNDKLLVLGLIWIATTAGDLFEKVFDESLFVWLESARKALGLDFWPSDWPVIAQVLLIFMSFEFVNYWYHRGAHQWYWLWKASGHGTHHAFKNLTAINAMANHPLEALFLMLPLILIGYFLGGKEVALAAGSFFGVITFMAHSNLDLNSKIIGYFFTTNRYHIHHHSMIREESNTNYGCACILWDRIFGTFRDADTEEAGIGKTQPTYAELFLMPFEEPGSSEIAPGVKIGNAAAY
jgi:sterol desaturase/sphingolipid hydroxylase (fatty acid hydroxylase superfamily)